MAKRPFILITPSRQRQGAEFADSSLSLSERYASAITDAGGVPFVVPCEADAVLAADWVGRCDGVMLSGGDDVQPGLYASRLPRRLRETVKEVDPARDYLELAIIEEVFRQRKPLLAICRGHQILNVALGGSLIVDLETQRPGSIDHRRMDRKDQVVHEVTLTCGSLLGSIAGKLTLGVNSSHHQAVDRVARPLQATAVSADGVVEALELHARDQELLPYLLSVQFHPERMYRRHAAFRDLFRTFTCACAVERR